MYIRVAGAAAKGGIEQISFVHKQFLFQQKLSRRRRTGNECPSSQPTRTVCHKVGKRLPPQKVASDEAGEDNRRREKSIMRAARLEQTGFPAAVRLAGFAAFLLLAAMISWAGASAETSPPILTVFGKINAGKFPGGARFSRDGLFALGPQTLVTETHFTTGAQRFEGVPLSALLDAVEASGSTLTATALDGYSIDLPVKDARRFGVFLAMTWNGETMKVRNKGPIWIIYPISRHPELNTEKYSARSIWQLKTLTVK